MRRGWSVCVLVLTAVWMSSCGSPTPTPAPTFAVPVVGATRTPEPPAPSAPTGSIEIVFGSDGVSYDGEAFLYFEMTQVVYQGRSYTGVRIRDLLETAGIDLQQATRVVAESRDGATQSLAPGMFLYQDAIIAFWRDGMNLPADEGAFRLIAGSVSLPGLVRLTVEGIPTDPGPDL